MMQNPAQQRDRDMARLFGRDCAYCGRQMTFNKQQKGAMNYATRDHIVPIARGGSKSKHQTVRVCRACNEDKFMLTLNEYRAVLTVRYGRIHVFAFEKKIPSLLVGIACLRLWQLSAFLLRYV